MARSLTTDPLPARGPAHVRGVVDHGLRDLRLTPVLSAGRSGAFPIEMRRTLLSPAMRLFRPPIAAGERRRSRRRRIGLGRRLLVAVGSPLAIPVLDRMVDLAGPVAARHATAFAVTKPETWAC